MEFLTQINDMLTDQLGEFGPLIVVGVLGLFMVLVTIPILLNQPEDPLKKLQRANGQFQGVLSPHHVPRVVNLGIGSGN